MDNDKLASNSQPLERSSPEETPVNHGIIVGKANKGPSRKKRAKILLLLSVIIIAAVGSLIAYKALFSKEKANNDNIVIGDTTITPDDLRRYAISVNSYKKQNPKVNLKSGPEQLAVDDLVMNAALKKEAKDSNLSLTEPELRKMYDIPSGVTDYRKVIDTYKNSDDTPYYQSITDENLALRNKLQKKLISDRSLSYVSINFDSPFFRSQKNSAAIEELHQQAKNKLRTEFLPLFENGVKIEEIAKKADANYVDGINDDQTYKLFFKKAAVSANYYEKYVDVTDSTGYLSPGVLKAGVPGSFKDLENVDYGTPVKDLKNTAQEINKLEKTGDHTGVFASKNGSYMIVRLENKTGGTYNSWQNLLDKYKAQYVKKTNKVSFSNVINGEVINGAGKTAKKLSDLVEGTAKAQEQTGADESQQQEGEQLPGDAEFNPSISGVNCGAHRITASISVVDIDTGAQVWTRVTASQSSAGCGAGRTVSSDFGGVSLTANCWGEPVTFTYRVPSGYSLVVVYRGDWNPGDVNETGAYSQIVYVRKNTPPPPPPDPRTTCGLSAQPARLPAGGGLTRVTWSSTGNQTGSITGIGVLGDAGQTNSRFGGSQQVFISATTTFIGTWTRTDKYPNITVTCTAKVNVGGNEVTDLCPNIDGIQDKIPDGLHLDENGDCVGPTLPSPPPTFSPYLRVYGNDVIVGSAFSSTETCSTNSTARIRAFNSSDIEDGRRVFTGSSGQYGVFDYAGTQDPTNSGLANGIEGFFSDNLRSKPSVQDGYFKNYGIANDLTFGNYYVGRGIPDPRDKGKEIIYGGRVRDYGGQSGILRCMPDYYKSVTDAGTPSIPGGTMSSVASVLANPIDDDQDVVVVVDGNLYIDKNIEYKNAETAGGWSSVDKIPSVVVIVKGNISISPDVTRLDGIFVAQPDASNDKGEIYTCGDSTGPLDLERDGRDIISEVCNKKLTVNGSFIAKKAVFYRTNGSVVCPDQDTVFPESRRVPCNSAAPNEPASSDRIAEVFNFSPEAYMTPLNVSLQSAVPFQKYDSVISLPPVF